MKRLLFAVALLLAATSALADETVRCESKGSRRRCAYDTPGAVTVEVKRQLSITECVQDQNWGVRNGEIWVDGGCRADFLVIQERRGYGRRSEGQTLVCESNGRYHRCEARIPSGVRIARQLSRTDCIRGRSWDYDRNGIWVDNGCRAEFYIEGGRSGRDRDDDDRDHHGRTERVTCESRDGKNVFCAAETQYGVELERQLSSTECVFRRNWGYTDRGIWVKDGCRAEFSVRTR
jgi:hypothetical protein